MSSLPETAEELAAMYRRAAVACEKHASNLPVDSPMHQDWLDACSAFLRLAQEFEQDARYAEWQERQETQ